jgi:hypothetical protein
MVFGKTHGIVINRVLVQQEREANGPSGPQLPSLLKK